MAAALAIAGCATQQSVAVKNQGNVDLTSFKCQNHTGSDFITRVCYDSGDRRLVIGFGDGTYRQYCRVDTSIANGLLSAPSIARFYGERIQGNGKISPFDCGAP
jgi:hypothetical protein